MDVKNINNELKNAPLDNKAGIKLIRLTGDKNISVFAAEILPKTKLKPHFHNHGIEIYQVLKGEGIMKVGEMKNNSPVWNETFIARQGDYFSINETNVHQIENASNSQLITIFTCPESHLGNDRFFIEDIGA